MLRYRLLTFDVNNTLIQVRNTAGDHYRRVAKMFGVEAKVPDLNRGFRVAYKEQVAVHPNFGATTGLTPEQWWTDVISRTFLTAGYALREGILAKISSKLYQDFSTSQTWETFPEVKEMLTFLNRNGVALGVLSNNDERLMSVLQSLDLAPHFAFILSSSEMKCEKPDAAFFRLALDRLAIDPALCAHIGDNVELDYFGAKAVGMDAYLVDRKGSTEENWPDISKDHILSDISDLETKIFKMPSV
ncbi:haloacid dehalogenase-like hydrolase domain-containing protein 3 [Diadema antillarum]|uniref:haloacid dehalogenase-like hydrolase domain-containing protein 3 n=1 Tax=Diadema antillarum TaxID=105358 RepID=UPI003A837864